MAISEAPVDHCDVLIVGAGPAGLMAATWMAKCGIDCRIVDKRNSKIFSGQADGIQSRTLEIFESLGFVDRVLREGHHIHELHFWSPDESGTIRPKDFIPSTLLGASKHSVVVALNQGRVERFLLDTIEECGGRPVDRGVLPVQLSIDKALVEDPHAYPITVRVKHLSESEATPKQAATSINGASVQDGLFRSNLAADDNAELLQATDLEKNAGKEEVIKAKYMLGADGAHSWVRQQLGFKLEGDSTDYIWGVIDIVPITDFPDIRMCCTVHSASSGSALIIPRENKLVRLYIQLTTLENAGSGGAKANRSNINPGVILQAAQRILAPYKIDYRRLDWWTAYQVGQRVGTSFAAHDRIFLAGDAVHTHSPKEGQGMNISMQDSFNLGWKIASVVKGISNRSILKTYQSERQSIARELIDFDYKFSRMFSGRPAKDGQDGEGISMKDFTDAFIQGRLFGSGLAVNYAASNIVAKEVEARGEAVVESPLVISKQYLATQLVVGQRTPSCKVVQQSDARPWDFQELLPSNGKWRVVIFTGDISNPNQRQKLDSMATFIDNKDSFLHKYTPRAAPDTVFDILAVHTAPRKQLSVFDFPKVFRPYDEIYGWDYSKIFVDDESSHGGPCKLYETFGVSGKGASMVIRPDQYVSYVGPMDDGDALNRFFGGFMNMAASPVNGKLEARNGIDHA